MKKLLLSTILLVFTSSLIAQDETPKNINYGNRIDKGTVLLSGAVSYDKTFAGVEKFTSTVGGQFALSERFALGIGFGLQTQNKHFDPVQFKFKGKEKTFSIAPGFTLFGKVGFGWLQPYLDVAIPIGFSTREKGVADEIRTTSFSGVLSPGLNIYLSRKLALTASLGLISYSAKKEKDKNGIDDAVHIGLSPADLSLGLVFILNRD